VEVDVVVPAVTLMIESCVTSGRRNSEQNADALNLIVDGLHSSQLVYSSASWYCTVPRREHERRS
jgi:hypothetical protein